MTKYIVQGGSPLFGEVHISGAKNAAVAILPAALLVDGVCRIENIPQISDVTVLLKILEQLGARVRVLNRSDVELDCRHFVLLYSVFGYEPHAGEQFLLPACFCSTVYIPD